MEFAEWVVAGLDQYRTGQLPQGQVFFTVVWNRLGTDPRVTAFMNTGDPAARQALLELVAQTLAEDPAFGPALQAAAPADGAAVGSGKKPFLKSTAGIVTIAVVAVAAIGGGVVLATSGGGKGLMGKLKGTWHCSPTAGTDDTGDSLGGTKDVTIGDGTWSVPGGQGTWKLNGGTLSLSSATSKAAMPITGIPDDYGPIHATAKGLDASDGNLDITGTASKNALVLKFTVVGAADDSANGPLLAVTCTRH